MPQKPRQSRTSRPSDIPPELVDFSCTKRKYGRPVTATAKIRNPQNNILETCSLKISPNVAARLQQDLLWHARNVAANHNPDLINDSVIGDLLAIAAGGPEKTKRQWLKALLHEAVEEDAPWIHWFAFRVSQKNRLSPDDKDLLEKILSQAKTTGYGKTLFQSKHRPPRYLYSTITAFLVEFCAGGANLWSSDFKCLPPMKLIKQSLERQRSRQSRQSFAEPTGVKNIFKEIFGNEYKNIIEPSASGAPPVPPAIHRLLNPSPYS